ncbi:hypothetical protein LXA43DRAFT_1178510 [Ganoderma leucocontextum]|nr:hypothetical protein LXA43DRAFT_1178510 [Ganoderma leucocontextum]
MVKTKKAPAVSKIGPNPSAETTPDLSSPSTRIDGALSFHDSRAPRYGLLALPPNLKWGTKALGRRSDIDEFLCVTNNPTTLWAIGTAHFLQLTAAADEHVITIRPLSPQLLNISRDLQYRRAHPPLTFPNNNLVYAIAPNPAHSTFDEAYDATDHLLPWTEMQDDKIEPNSLRLGDTVLIEMYVHRHKTKPAENRKWTTWSISFDLIRIAALFRLPAPITLPPDSRVNL